VQIEILYSVPEGIGMAMKLRDGRSGVRIPVGASDFFSPKCPDRHCGSRSPLRNGYWDSFPRVKWPKRDVNHSSPYSAEVRNERSYTGASTRPKAFKECKGTTLRVLLSCS
jgi:hypothetical protein